MQNDDLIYDEENDQSLLGAVSRGKCQEWAGRYDWKLKEVRLNEQSLGLDVTCVYYGRCSRDSRAVGIDKSQPKGDRKQ